MSIPRFDDVRDRPLVTDEEVLERASALFGRAIRRQAWLMFLDEQGRQLPIMLPGAVPRMPGRGHRENYARVLAELVAELEAHALVIAFERCGADALAPADRAWLSLLRDACREAGIPLRGPLLVHDDGVRWISPEDLDA